MSLLTRDELKALKLPDRCIKHAVVAETRTKGTHFKSGARIYQNAYNAWSIAYGNVWDQYSLDKFVALCAKRGFVMDSIPGLAAEVLKRAKELALEYQGTKYNFPE